MKTWIKSSYSYGNGGNCIEGADTLHTVHLRDSQNRDPGQLSFPRAEWASLLSDIKAEPHRL